MVDKRRAKQGHRGGNYTPAQAKKLLAKPVYAVLNRHATPIFPGTSLAGPSGIVGIFRLPGRQGRGLSGIGGVALPVWINERQWERAVVPVLTDPRWAPANLTMKSIQVHDLSLLVGMIGDSLALSFHKAGYGPLPAGMVLT